VERAAAAISGVLTTLGVCRSPTLAHAGAVVTAAGDAEAFEVIPGLHRTA
jgi:hypothetical protein